MIAKVTGNRSTAEDVLDDAIMRALSNASNVQPKTFVTWLFTIARNMAIDLWRREERRRRALAKANLPLFERSAVLDAMGREAVALFNKLIKGMPAKMRRYLRLRVIQGLTHSEIAKRTGQTDIALRNMAHRVRERLEWWREEVVGS